MTREEAKKLLPIIQAFAEGKTIQYLANNKKWTDIDDPVFTRQVADYRIKSEPKYRPFQTKEECWDEMLKHQPFSYIMDDRGNVTQVNGLKLDAFNELFISISCSPSIFETNYLCDRYKFIDGTPFGIKEE